jgi:hypothetical protein
MCELEVATGKFQIADYVGNVLLWRKETVSQPTRTLDLGNEFRIFVFVGTYYHESMQWVNRNKSTMWCSYKHFSSRIWQKISSHDVLFYNQRTYTDCDYIMRIHQSAITVHSITKAKILAATKEEWGGNSCDRMPHNTEHGLLPTGNREAHTMIK